MLLQSLQSPAKHLTAKLPSTLHSLRDLALNFWWSWVPEGEYIFRDIDEQKWEQCQQNPVQFLMAVANDRLKQLSTDAIYLQCLQSVATKFEEYMQPVHTWAQQEG